MIETQTDSPPKSADSEGSGVGQHRLVRHLDLFSGIGGFALAAQMVGGIETVGFGEVEPFACKVLAKNFPTIKNYGDIRKIKGLRAELVTGGYPCQPFSSLGHRRGAEDHRHLWPSMRGIIEESRPRWVLSENVVAHVTMGLDEVLDDLGAMGYTSAAMVIPACALDARHRRDRVWIVAGDSDGFDGDSLRLIQDDFPSASREGWRVPSPGMDRGANGIPNAVDRNRGLGNAIVPQVAAEILRCMMRVDSLAKVGSSAAQSEATANSDE